MRSTTGGSRGGIPGLVTFGEGARGELYAGSVSDGRIDRLTL